MNRDQLAKRLLATFVGELEEQVRTMNADLLVLETEPTDPERLKSVFRIAHTLKGAARAAGVPLVEQVCHVLETRLVEARDGKIILGREEFVLLFAAADALGDAGQRIKGDQSLAGSPLADLHQRMTGAKPTPAPTALGPAGALPPVLSTTVAIPRGNGQVRVDAQKLDALVASTGQLLVANGRLASRTEELQGLHDFAAAWAIEWQRASSRLRIELERMGSGQSIGPVFHAVDANLRRLVQDTGRLVGGVAEDARVLSQVTDQLAVRVRELRMRPFAEACEALPRAVRDLGVAAGKDVQLQISGGDVEADRAVLDGLREAILQLVRNAVDHGIESSPERLHAGKPPAGMITVEAALKGDRIVVTVADDGAGLRMEGIKEQLRRRGLSVPRDERDLARTLFEGGISTRNEASAISGRGVGLDIVRAAVARIRATVDVAWVEGRGTTFRLECPPTLVTIRALLVAVGSSILALPTTDVERLLRVRPEEIKRAEGRDVLTTSGSPVPLIGLARLLGPPLLQTPIAGPMSVVLLVTGVRRLAVVVDELLVEQEIVLRPLGGDSRALRYTSGAALLESGRVALVLNAAAIVAGGLALDAGPGLTAREGMLAAGAKRRILVVDDSITTRALEQSILHAAGYEVSTAVDGADGWKVLQEQGADLVVSDVEMPRMDGFALCEAIRAAKRFKQVPIVLVTALETPEQRARGLEVGADAYLGKSSFDQEGLLETIMQLLGEGGVP